MVLLIIHVVVSLSWAHHYKCYMYLGTHVHCDISFIVYMRTHLSILCNHFSLSTEHCTCVEQLVSITSGIPPVWKRRWHCVCVCVCVHEREKERTNLYAPSCRLTSTLRLLRSPSDRLVAEQQLLHPARSSHAYSRSHPALSFHAQNHTHSLWLTLYSLMTSTPSTSWRLCLQLCWSSPGAHCSTVAAPGKTAGTGSLAPSWCLLHADTGQWIAVLFFFPHRRGKFRPDLEKPRARVCNQMGVLYIISDLSGEAMLLHVSGW